MKRNLFYKIIEYLYFQIPGNLALYDRLTHVYNSNWLHNIAYKKYANRPCYITLIDVNNFKQINDFAGHVIGDSVLEGLGKRLGIIKEFDKTAEICRLGGDEFVVFSKLNIEMYLAAIQIELISYGVCFKSGKLPVEDALTIADSKMYEYKGKYKEPLQTRQDVIRTLQAISYIDQKAVLSYKAVFQDR